jgi:ABC-2 type transport system ATP-binding protein
MGMLVAENVSRRYGETVALDGVSFSISEGEVFGLVGPNGAGKTTLARALTGTTEYRGHVELWGTEPQSVGRERLGLLPQDFSPPDRLTAREIVAFYSGLYDGASDTEELLATVGLDQCADTYYENLSGGQKRRTCVASALVNDPDLLVLDEPTTGIDPAGRQALWRTLQELAAGGTTIFFTTHYMAEAHELADYVGMLADGQLVAVDPPEQLIRQYGGESLLYIEGISGDESGDTPRSGVLDTVLEGYEFSLGDDQLTVRDVPPDAIGGIAGALEDAGVTYDSLTWTEPDLEDVYLELTGQNRHSEGHSTEMEG